MYRRHIFILKLGFGKQSFVYSTSEKCVFKKKDAVINMPICSLPPDNSGQNCMLHHRALAHNPDVLVGGLQTPDNLESISLEH